MQSCPKLANRNEKPDSLAAKEQELHETIECVVVVEGFLGEARMLARTADT